MLQTVTGTRERHEGRPAGAAGPTATTRHAAKFGLPASGPMRWHRCWGCAVSIERFTDSAIWRLLAAKCSSVEKVLRLMPQRGMSTSTSQLHRAASRPGPSSPSMLHFHRPAGCSNGDLWANAALTSPMCRLPLPASEGSSPARSVAAHPSPPGAAVLAGFACYPAHVAAHDSLTPRTLRLARQPDAVTGVMTNKSRRQGAGGRSPGKPQDMHVRFGAAAFLLLALAHQP